ncbi:MAG: ATP-binding protein [Desulfobacteraceae bacterium]|nr:ATP-binding protein [Desulfobacteraceae bacterium]
MAKKKKKNKKKKKKVARKPKNKQPMIQVDVKVRILHTIADAIYSTPAGKLREAVANARDNDATWVIIVVDQATRSISICDNGCGITDKRFSEIFEAIGYGLLRDAPEKKLSYFGLGLMSIFQLGKKVEIFTRAKGTSKILKLEVDTDAIFSEENEKKSISELGWYIQRTKSNEVNRRAASVSLLNESLGGEQFKNSWESFTEIIIRDITTEDFEVICDDDFVDDLRKWLPLAPERDEPFLKRLTGKKGKEIRKILEDKEFCKTVDVFFGMQEDAMVDQLWKYFPMLRSDLTFPDDNVYVGSGKDGDFAYYLVHSVAVDLQKGIEGDERETGFWVRNQNFLVKSADFLERTGPGRKIKPVHAPLKPWLFGEIFHKDMNQFLTVSRNEFLFDKELFKKFQNEIVQIVSPLNKELRQIYDNRKKIVDGLVEPFSKFAAKDGTIAKTDQKLREMVQSDLDENKAREKIITHLKKIRKKEIENKQTRIDEILKRNKKSITLGEDKDAFVKIDPALKGKGQDFDVTWDAQNCRVIVSISPDLFEPKQVLFLGQTFTICFVAEKEKAPGASIDVDGKFIYINPFNEDLTRYSISIFDVYIALQIAKAISPTKDELVKNTLMLLGDSSPITKKYITPLGDDLRRTAKLA